LEWKEYALHLETPKTAMPFDMFRLSQSTKLADIMSV
jgi:hypothetical protein